MPGCDSGFGNALARRLDSLGLMVFAGCLKYGQAGERELVEECSDRLHTLQLDVTDPEQIQETLIRVKGYLSPDKGTAISSVS